MGTGTGKVVVNRAMSLDGFIAGPGDEMGWIAELAPQDAAATQAAATGAMLAGRRTWEVGARMEADEPGSTDYPFTGPMFLLTHRPLAPPDVAAQALRRGLVDEILVYVPSCRARWRHPVLALGKRQGPAGTAQQLELRQGDHHSIPCSQGGGR